MSTPLSIYYKSREEVHRKIKIVKSGLDTTNKDKIMAHLLNTLF